VFDVAVIYRTENDIKILYHRALGVGNVELMVNPTSRSSLAFACPENAMLLSWRTGPRFQIAAATAEGGVLSFASIEQRGACRRHVAPLLSAES
jgi:hypothetical protein